MTTLVITTTALPRAIEGQPYSQTLQASGGIPPYTWSVGAGSLPAGVSLSSAGVLDGTPSVTGVFNFDAQVIDSA